jgi:hypothetical protein
MPRNDRSSWSLTRIDISPSIRSFADKGEGVAIDPKAKTKAGTALRVLGGVGVGVGIVTSLVPLISVGAGVAVVGHLLYRRGKAGE